MTTTGRRAARAVAALLLVAAGVVALSSPSVTGSEGTVECGPTVGAVLLMFPSDPAPGEGWAVQPCNVAVGSRWLVLIGLLALSGGLLWWSRDRTSRHVVLPPMGS
jgi:hypothetical protein